MRTDKLTSRFQQALADAQSIAVGRDNNMLEDRKSTRLNSSH